MKSKVIKIDRLFVVKSILVCLFLLYTLMIIDFTLINDSFGRSISNIFLADKATVNEYLSQKINLVPFATVKLFIKAYKDSNLDTLVVIENILGNLFVFMPFAFFVPYIFKRINSAFKFLLCISVSVLIIEVLQIVFLTGSADIDDFILNVAGAMLAYGVLNVPKIKRTVNKFLFGEVNETKG
ncbi:MAG: VanZ family protein [Clostridia bacterium]|nr:VanZ family protein [Clostridia bacterium]